MKALVTGATGFLGNFLVRQLINKGIAVIGTTFDPDDKPVNKNPEAKFQWCDVRDTTRVRRFVSEVKPDVIFHLAAQTYLTASWEDPITTFQTNVMGTINLLEAVRREGINPKIVLACSSGEYGETANTGRSLKETDPLLPVSPYGVSKVCQDLQGFQYHKSFGLRTIRARIFGTIGPGKIGDFCADFCGRIAAIEAGMQRPVMKVGKLETARDLRGVNDTVRALILLSEKGEHGDVYNICSGKATTIRNSLETLLKLSSIKIKVEEDSSKYRPSDEAIILGDNSKIKKLCGWEPAEDLEHVLSETLNYWRHSVKENNAIPTVPQSKPKSEADAKRAG